MVSLIELSKFEQDYKNGHYPNLRFGQAFFNEFYHRIKEFWQYDPKLVYEENENKAKMIILNHYIK